MNRAAVFGLIQRRGNVIDWWRAIPPDPSTINEAMGQPIAALGRAAQLPVGPFGESYPTTPYKIRAFLSSKFTTAQFQLWGNLQVGDMQLDVAVPFQPDLAAGITPLPPDWLCAYNEGRFAQVRRRAPVMMPQGSSISDAPETITFDRFAYGGRMWTAKARAVPLVDQNVTFAYRLLIGEFSI